MMSTAQAQAISSSTVTGPQSMVLLKNMLRLSVSSICYMRSIFPAECFSSRDYAGLQVHQLECAEKAADGTINVRYPEAFLLTQWLERGVFEALEKRYLKSLTFAVYTKHPKTKEDALLETYQFLVEYPDPHSATLNGMTMTRDSLKKQAVTFIRCLVEFTNTLEELPSERWLTMKILYYDEATPRDYEPEFFVAAKSDVYSFFGNPLKIKIGKLETPHHTLQLRFAGLESLLLEDQEKIQPITEDKSTSFLANNHNSNTTEFKTPNDKTRLVDESLLKSMSSLMTATKPQKSPEKSIVEESIEMEEDNDDTDEEIEDPTYILVRDYVIAEGRAIVKECADKFKLKANAVTEVFHQLVKQGIIKKCKGKGYIIASSNINKEKHKPEGRKRIIQDESIPEKDDNNCNEETSLDDFTQSHEQATNKRIKEDTNRNIPKIEKMSALSQESVVIHPASKCSIIKDPLIQFA